MKSHIYAALWYAFCAGFCALWTVACVFAHAWRYAGIGGAGLVVLSIFAYDRTRKALALSALPPFMREMKPDEMREFVRKLDALPNGSVLAAIVPAEKEAPDAAE